MTGSKIVLQNISMRIPVIHSPPYLRLVYDGKTSSSRCSGYVDSDEGFSPYSLNKVASFNFLV